jgi:hypothetical protein
LVWLACIALVAIGSLLPDNSLPIRALYRLNISDQIQHVAAYAVLAFLPVIHERPRVLGAIIIGLIGLGVLLEFGQMLESRDFEIGDMVGDTAGVFVGIVAAAPLRGHFKRHLDR